MKNLFKKKKAKVGHLIDMPSREGSRWQSPATLNPDLEQVSSVLLPLEQILPQVPQPSRATETELTVIMQRSQILITQSPVSRDPGPISPDSLSELQISQVASVASSPEQTEMAPLASNESVRRAPVCTACPQPLAVHLQLFRA